MMAANFFRHRTSTAVAQVDTVTITADSTSNTAVWTFTLTLPNGDSETVAYTEDGSPTVAEIRDGLVAAWNLSTKPHIAQITAAAGGAGVLTLTADTAGVPFVVTLADNDDGTHTHTTTTANVGDNDYGTARNWQLDAVPIATNDVRFDMAATMKDIFYGLDQSGVAIGDFRVVPGCTTVFGRFDNGVAQYLKIDPDSFLYEGAAGLALFDIGSANIAATIKATAPPATTGRHAIYFKGSNVTTLSLLKGNIGIAPLPGETATVATIKTSYVSVQQTDVRLTIGSGVTLTTLDLGGGVCLLKCAATTVTNGFGSTLTTDGTGAIGTLNAYGVCDPNSTGTITTLNAFPGCTVDLSKSKLARTITTLNKYPGSNVILGSWVTVTNTIDIKTAGPGTITTVVRG
jgi:hypothetical protein